MKGKKAAKSIIYNAIILAIGLIMIYPLVWMIMSSFKETNIIFKTAGQLIPKNGYWIITLMAGKVRRSIIRTILFKFPVHCGSGYHRNHCFIRVGRIWIFSLSISRERDFVRSDVGIYDASGTGFDDSAVFMVSETGLGRKLFTVDCSVFFCNSGILRIPD